MPNNIKNILNDFVEEVKKILGNRVKRIVLYGSYARGDYNKGSDIDIMILTDLSDKEISEYSMKIWEKSADIEIDYGIVISSLVRNIDNFEAWSDVKPFYINIINEGVVLVGEKKLVENLLYIDLKEQKKNMKQQSYYIEKINY